MIPEGNPNYYYQSFYDYYDYVIIVSIGLLSIIYCYLSFEVQQMIPEGSPILPRGTSTSGKALSVYKTHIHTYIHYIYIYIHIYRERDM